MKHCGTQTLETPRLLLRPLRMDDCEMMFNNWAGDAEITRYLRWDAHPNWAYTAELLNEWEKHYAEPNYYQWGICEKSTGILIGCISLFSDSEMRTGWHANLELLGFPYEVGFALGRKWHNRGYMTEALCAVRDFWLTAVGAPWLTACFANGNDASCAVLQKAGFTYDHDVTIHRFNGAAVACRACKVLKEDV